jgi:dolichyl-phosphate beta-glucosyltransferase
MLDLSVVIPAYNEELRLPSTFEAMHKFLAESGLNFEIIVVNDGSKDGTVRVVQDLARHNEEVRLLSYEVNKGKGYAVKTGVLSAKGNLILIDDADGSSPIEEFMRLKVAIDNGADIAIGSRAKPNLERRVEALVYRKYIGNIFNKIVQSLLLPGIHDTQCGLKLFKQHVAKDLFSLSLIEGYAFDVEILYLAKLRCYVVEEVAINWTNVAGSKVNVMRDSIIMLVETLKITMNGFLGRYKSPVEIKVND